MKLLCPLCKQPLTLHERTFGCDNHHTFDQAKQGYVNLLLKQKASGDNQEMVIARQQFLQKGHYEPLVTFLQDLLDSFPNEVIVDAGCGEGYYTNQIAGALASTVFGFDVSKVALQKAAKSKAGVQYAVASIFEMPLANESADVVLNVFAPIAAEEFARILKEDGLLVVVGPGVNHLLELKKAIYEEVVLNEEHTLESEHFTLIDHFRLHYNITLNSQEEIQHLFTMTPYYYKTKAEDAKKLESLTSLTTTVDFSIKVYVKKEENEQPTLA
ncbi:MAG: putative RNA methyltransferase [Erysipelotrichaceae bacterium]